MTIDTDHVWIVGLHRADRERALAQLGTPGTAIQPVWADCHRRLRGPYSGLGAVLRTVAPEAFERWPDLVRKHQIEILSLAPEMRHLIDAPLETLTSLAIPEERTRFYAAARTRRLAHGVVELLSEFSRRRGLGPLVLSLENVHAADESEQELIAILLRRADPSQLRVIAASAPQGPTEELTAALTRHARRLDAEPPGPAEPQDVSAETLVRAYVASDGTSDVPAEVAAYEQAAPSLRSSLHDRRAEELEGSDQWSLRLGAIPYHREHGSDPAVVGGEALMRAVDYCLDMGFYPAVVDLGMRGRAVIDPDRQPRLYHRISTKVTTALAALGRPEEAESIYLESRERYALPVVHLTSSYALAMLYTRFHAPERRDHHLAKMHVNNSIALASQMEDPRERAFQTVFQQNGLALIEMHLGNLEAARTIVTEGLERLNRELPDGAHGLHRSVLLHNRSQVHTALGMLDEALADLDAVIELDPNYAEYHFDRGNLLRRLGDDEGALAAYCRAMTLTPPFAELYYNRADVLASMGDRDGAIADFSYVLELEPDHLDARINRATLLLEAGDLAGAAADVDRGLALDGDNAHLLCTRGLVAMESGDPERAHASFSRAIELAPDLHAARSNRAMVAFGQGAFDEAISDLTEALRIAGEDPDLLFNRGFVLQRTHRWDAALRDYSRAMQLPGADMASLLYQRGLCHAEAMQTERSRSDLEACIRLGEGSVAQEAQAYLDALATSGGRS